MPVETPSQVVIHPLVLLSVTDHYNRVAQGTSKRVVGILLGEWRKGKVDVTNSYAVPFEEDRKDPSIWFLDHNYHENMSAMFKKVNAREKVVGWYSTGPKIKPADLDIHEKIRDYCAQPVYSIIKIGADESIPVDSYCSVENTPEERTKSKRTFAHLPTVIEATEPEEIGVEHLLRDVRDRTVSTLTTRVEHKSVALRGLQQHVDEMHKYLENVIAGKMPVNHAIVYEMQNILNLSPNLNVDKLIKSFAATSNDQALSVYLSSLIRSILALHNLINNLDDNLNRDKKSVQDKAKQSAEGKTGTDDDKKKKTTKEGESSGKDDTKTKQSDESKK